MCNDTRTLDAPQAPNRRLMPLPATWEDMVALGLNPETGEPLDDDESEVS